MFWTVSIIVVLIYKLVDWCIRSLKVKGVSRKYVFVTGCDTGFGEALALQLDALGFHVIAGCLSNTGKNALSARGSSRLITLTVDVGDTTSVERTVDLIKKKLPRNTGLWAVVNNAGISGPLTCAEMCPQQDFARVIAVNLLGPIQICRSLMPLVRMARGRVVNTTSTCGFFASLGSAYPASKFGLEGFTDALRREVQDKGVKVSILEPGFFKTNIVNLTRVEKSMSDAFNQADEEVKAAYGPDYVRAVMTGISMVNATAPNDSQPVVDAYIHAIVSKYPRSRYVIGKDANILVVIGHFMPTWIADWIMWFGRWKARRSVGKKTCRNF